MLGIERKNEIINMVEKDGSVTARQLAIIYHTSVETIRRDLLELEKDNKLKRVHGGAVAINNRKANKSLVYRMDEYMSLKIELSVNAVQLIDNGDIIAIDSGSTANAFADVLLKTFSNLTILTHSFDVFSKLAHTDGFEVYLMSGKFDKSENSFYGENVINMYNNYHVSKSFLSPSAISLKGGMQDYEPNLVSVQKKMIEICDKPIYMADSTKFEKTAFVKIIDIHNESTIVTDGNLSDEIYNDYKEKEINIIRGEIK